MVDERLVKRIAENQGCTDITALEWLDAVCFAITELLVEDGKLNIRNMFKMEIKDQSLKEVINPKTLEKSKVKYTKRLSIKPGNGLRQAIQDYDPGGDDND